MSTIPFTRKEKHDVEPKEIHDDKPSEEIQESIHTSEHEINTMEGSEFLDDRIRMKNQPYCETTSSEDE